MTRVQISSLATRSPFVSQVDVLKRAPGITSRVFPACNACQNALTLTDSSSALNIAQKPHTGSHSGTSVVSAPSASVDATERTSSVTLPCTSLSMSHAQPSYS